ncbi:hypothetical protein MKX01_029430 [Papaver californicum]|nr:hypothetical protein MKX01_029430 [Papaver californicum]
MGEVTVSLAKKHAEQIQSRLNPKIPSLIIVMLPSQVSGGYWLGIPKPFCTDFMWKKDTTKMTLVDQKGEKYEVTYIPGSTGLSGGWKRFAMDHSLRVGDAVLFQLVNLKKFKVFIVRKNGVADTDDGGADTDDGKDISGAISLLQLKEQMQNNSRVCVQCNSNPPLIIYKFSVFVFFLLQEGTYPTKYYKLCCRQNSFLHTNLVPGFDCKEVAGIISETVKIADAIRSCKLIDTSKGELTVWKKSLGELEQLGMSISFLIPRLGELMQVSERAEYAENSMSYRESVIERKKYEQTIISLKMKHLKLKDAMKRVAFDIRVPAVMHANFVTIMNAPW